MKRHLSRILFELLMAISRTNRRRSTSGNITFSDRYQGLGPYKKHWKFHSFGNRGGFNDIDEKTSNHIISLEKYQVVNVDDSPTIFRTCRGAGIA